MTVNRDESLSAEVHLKTLKRHSRQMEGSKTSDKLRWEPFSFITLKVSNWTEHCFGEEVLQLYVRNVDMGLLQPAVSSK